MRVKTNYAESNIAGNKGDSYSISKIINSAKKAESYGFDIFSASETSHNPYLPLVLAAEHTDRVELQTSIALAFSRSPMDTAYLAWDLQNISEGRFTLGLGSQVKGHIKRRFSMPWSPPASRMREYILALKHIWSCWQDGKKLNFESENYAFNLMPPFFDPGPIANPNIKVAISAVNPYMLALAGELCDGVTLHSFTTPKYTQEVVIPNLQKGASKSGRAIGDIKIEGGGFIVAGHNEEDLESKITDTRNRISFYASTRSYAPVMEVHGWEDVHEKLYRMSIDGDWGNMGSCITDEILNQFAVIGTYDEIASKIKDRYGDYTDSVWFPIEVNDSEDEDILRNTIASLQSTEI
jgi:probable F420-dependent oxidoreductase